MTEAREEFCLSCCVCVEGRTHGLWRLQITNVWHFPCFFLLAVFSLCCPRDIVMIILYSRDDQDGWKPKRLLPPQQERHQPSCLLLGTVKYAQVKMSQQSSERNPSRSRGALEDRVRQGKICEQGGGGKRNNSGVGGITNHHRHNKGLRDPLREGFL